MYADEILDYSGVRPTGVVAGSYGPSADQSPEAGGTITVPQLTVNENGAVTGAVNRTITFPSGGGGGGAEEQFEKVYETTLSQDVSSSLTISANDMNGKYVDVVLYVQIPQTDGLDTIEADMMGDGNAFMGNGVASISSSIFKTYCAFCAHSFYGVGITVTTKLEYGVQEYSSDIFFSPDQLYPSITIPCISQVVIIALKSGEAGTLPSGTIITVYARRKVTAPEPEP